MSKSAWPNVAEVTSRLEGLGVTVIPAGISVQDEIDAAIACLHRAIGFSPFLAGSETTYDYDAPRSFTLLLGAPFFTVTGVKINKSNDYAGDDLTEGIDYWLKPGVPYGWIDLATRQYGDDQSIEVTGKKGVTDDIPVDLWNAVRDYAAASVLEVAVGTGAVMAGPVSNVRQGAVSVDFGTKSEPLYVTLRDKSLEVFKAYKRPAAVGLPQ